MVAPSAISFGCPFTLMVTGLILRKRARASQCDGYVDDRCAEDCQRDSRVRLDTLGDQSIRQRAGLFAHLVQDYDAEEEGYYAAVDGEWEKFVGEAVGLEVLQFGFWVARAW